MSSAKPGKVDEIQEASKSGTEEHASKRQKAVDANATDARSQNWTQYSDSPHHYGPPDTTRQTGNTNLDGTYAREKVKIRYYAARLYPTKSYLLVHLAT